MKITWLGHGGFRIELADAVLLIDPWMDGNPVFPADQKDAAIEGATHIFLTHGHFDHTAGVEEIAATTGAPVFAMVELAGILTNQGTETTGFNMGGTIAAGAVDVTMVPASHSSSITVKDRLLYAGTPNGFVLRGGGHSVYLSGDTGLMADMAWIGDYFQPDTGILSAGGHFTMDMAQAAYACKTYFKFDTVIPCHFKTFPLLEQNADPLIYALPDTHVIATEVMAPITI